MPWVAARGARGPHPHLKVQRENLKGPAAARAIAQQHGPSTYDRDIARGDKDHTQQLTDLKLDVKK